MSGLAFPVPEGLLDALAERVAARLADDGRVSPRTSYLTARGGRRVSPLSGQEDLQPRLLGERSRTANKTAVCSSVAMSSTPGSISSTSARTGLDLERVGTYDESRPQEMPRRRGNAPGPAPGGKS